MHRLKPATTNEDADIRAVEVSTKTTTTLQKPGNQVLTNGINRSIHLMNTSRLSPGQLHQYLPIESHRNIRLANALVFVFLSFRTNYLNNEQCTVFRLQTHLSLFRSSDRTITLPSACSVPKSISIYLQNNRTFKQTSDCVLFALDIS